MTDHHWLVERRLSPARLVEVQALVRAVQHGWRRYADGTGWRAAVRFVSASHDGQTPSDADLPVERVRGSEVSRR